MALILCTQYSDGKLFEGMQILTMGCQFKAMAPFVLIALCGQSHYCTSSVLCGPDSTENVDSVTIYLSQTVHVVKRQA